VVVLVLVVTYIRKVRTAGPVLIGGGARVGGDIH